MSTDQDLLEKIKKLLALSNSSNPYEAVAALRRAQKLMTEHGITQLDIDLAEICEYKVKFPTLIRSGRIYSYVSGIIAKAIGVEHILLRGKKGFSGVLFVGNRQQLELAEYVFTVLTRQLAVVKQQYEHDLETRYRNDRDVMHELEQDFLSQAAIRDAYGTPERYIRACLTKSVRVHSVAYLKGWISTIYAKIEQVMVGERERTLIERYMADNFPDLGVSSARRSHYTPSQRGAYQQGRKDGQNNFLLFAGINGGRTQPKKLGHQQS